MSFFVSKWKNKNKKAYKVERDENFIFWIIQSVFRKFIYNLSKIIIKKKSSLCYDFKFSYREKLNENLKEKNNHNKVKCANYLRIFSKIIIIVECKKWIEKRFLLFI